VSDVLICRRCGMESTDPALFIKPKGRPFCRKCQNKEQRELRARQPKRLRNLKKAREAARRYASRNPEKRRAWNRVFHAVERGHMQKPDRCSECGKTGRLEAHHEDYSKPLEVEWLCRKCHQIKDGRVAA